MRGEGWCSQEPVRRVFKAVGSLVCWRLELEWAEQTRATGSVEETLLISLPSSSTEGVDVKKTWKRWREYADTGSAFASGKFDIAKEVIDQAVKLGLLKEEEEEDEKEEKKLSNRTKAFFQLLKNISSRTFSFDSDQLDEDLDNGYSTIFRLAEIAPDLKKRESVEKEEFLDLRTDQWFLRGEIPPGLEIPGEDYRAHVIDAAFEALDATKILELAMNRAYDILEKESPRKNADSVSIRELLLVQQREVPDATNMLNVTMSRGYDVLEKESPREKDPNMLREFLFAQYSEQAVELVLQLHDHIALSYGSEGNSPDLAAKIVKKFIGKVNAKAKVAIDSQIERWCREVEDCNKLKLLRETE